MWRSGQTLLSDPPPALDSAIVLQPERFASVDELVQRAARLASSPTDAEEGADARAFLAVLTAEASRIEAGQAELAAQSPADRLPVEAWLHDNLHVVREQIRAVRRDLSRAHYRSLPTDAGAPFRSLPRVYALACELAAHTGGRIDMEVLRRFVDAYQGVTTLTIGELWALPSMLRGALLRHLSHLTDEIVERRRQRRAAQRYLAAYQGSVGRAGPRESPPALPPTLAAPFVVQLIHDLRDLPPSASPLWRALESRLGLDDTRIDEIGQHEHSREAFLLLAVSNLIASMRQVAAIDWHDFVEGVSIVDSMLREDPAGAYGGMDFATRDAYRRAVERVAGGADAPETEVAHRALELARASPGNDRRGHVGYYLVSDGRTELERVVGARPTRRCRLGRAIRRHAALAYFASLVTLTFLATGALVAMASEAGGSAWTMAAAGVLALVPGSEIAVQVLHGLVTSFVPPRLLPKLDFSEGVPTRHRTLVVVPSMLTSLTGVERLLRDLEVRSLANHAGDVRFALLTDFPDADAEHVEGDDTLVGTAAGGIRVLNERHGHERFLLLHRRRSWNPHAGRWMGWERKRGKLVELNRLLRRGVRGSFACVVGSDAWLRDVRYVVTLDADTQIPAGTIQRLAGAMAHPLNRPDIDPATRRVVRGYGIMQPRVDIDLESAEATVFAAAASGGSGFDPYARAVSDVYQDTFDEGSYVGKGIYDVSAFRTALADRVPDHRLLSHDLFEGLYARTGLCSDIHVIDDYPSHYLAWAVRQHRWTRGDWQIARWLTARVPTESGASVRNVLPWVSRWKIADNLRRSLLPASVVAMCTYGWTAAPGSPGAWTLIALLPLALPSMRAVGDAALSRVRGVPWRAHLHAERPRLRGLALQFGLTTCFLLHHAIVELDAVARTLYRLAVDRRHLLEWESSADASVRLGATRMHTYAEMASSTALGFAILVACLLVAPDRVRYALPLAAGWMFAPELAHLTARPRRGGDERLGLADSRYLRRCARRCWSFFEDLVVAERRFLVPDNYQPDRVGPIASRTSPTNIGLQLVADVAAGDFGYIGTRQLMARVERTTQGLEDLPTYRGHFYNWYDLATLQPLAPAYVSTVDSGNLAAHLLTVRQALDSLVRTTPLLDARTFDGLEDLVDVCAEEASRAEGSDVRPEPNRAIGVLMTRLRARPRTLSGWSWLLTELTERHALLEAAIPPAGDSWRRWSERLGASLAERRAELEPLRPALSWLDRLAPPRIETAWLPPPAGVSAWIDERLASHRSSAGSEVLDALAAFREQAADLVARTDRLQVRLLTLVTRMDFRFLYDERRDLFSIGYNAADNRLDSALYDLLASESRLTSLVAIALDQAPVRHWFKLGRPVVAPTTSTRALVSWSASMFEYLMPALVTKLFPQTLLTRTCRAAVDTHIRYGQQRGVPWGMSEAAYALRDRAGNYQYKAFGVPGLGLKAGLGDELVVAPYASFLAAMLRPATAARNLRALSRMGLEGRYGFYEALDYGRTRPATTAQVVRTYMAHHVGMSLAALDNVLHDNVLQAHFHAEPRVRAVELLLQEQPPVPAPIATSDAPATRAQTPATPSTAARRYSTPHTLGPRAHLLSNGHYMVMLTNAGGGFSAVQDVHVTRWREDAAEDRWGAFLYLRDLGTRRVWSATYQPTRVEPDEYHVEFDTARARYRRRDGDLETILEVTTGLDDRAEARRLTIVNHGTRVRTIEITTYAEVVLATLAADTAHPAFSNLFVRTEAPWPGALLAERRSREGGANHFAVHVLAGPATEAIEHETDRSRFIGRGGTVQAPAALMRDEPLSGTEGFVLDPVFSLRRVLKLGARARVNVAVALGYARTRDDALALLSKYRDPVTIDHAFFVARSRNDIELREFNLSPEQAMRFQRLASRLLFPDARLRSTAAIERNRRPVRELWKHGISGDLPILLVRVSRPEELDLVRELLTAHEYHRRRGFRFDLVILNAHEASYRREVQDELARLSRSGPWASYAEEPGGVFLRQASTMSSEDGLLLEAAARAICDGRLGSVEDQLRRLHRPLVQPDLLPIQATWRREAPTATAADPEHDLEFWNGFGGFGPDGTTYEIRPDEGLAPPAPWTNVLANPRFGCLTTDSGMGCTWAENSQRNRLTPWANDPVTDPPSEVVFVRDAQTGAFWSATPAPRSERGRYRVVHGFGITRYHRHGEFFDSTLTVVVPPEDTVKVVVLELTHRGDEPRLAWVALYAELVLGARRGLATPMVTTSRDSVTGALFARHAADETFGGRLTFLATDRAGATVTGDRLEFLGRNGSLADPAAMHRVGLSNRVGAALDPCAAIAAEVTVPVDGRVRIAFVFGQTEDEDAARTLIARYASETGCDEALDRATSMWSRFTGSIIVRTPDPAFDRLVNGWLPYQTLGCRLWGRTSFYQSSGAFGFRDQLQDVLALVPLDATIARAHLIRAASRQYPEGDVQHWWHEPEGDGIRTHCSDDRLWLVYAALEYVRMTGDSRLLDEPVPFLEGRMPSDTGDVFDRPRPTEELATLYEHCARAVDSSLRFGARGLPLIGSSDWNDGYDLVGPRGRGESVWLGWFLMALLPQMARWAADRGDLARVERYAVVTSLREALEGSWDGGWYRRAYFDDGTPLGSRANAEARIDSVAQTWAVLSGAAGAGRQREAMSAVARYLVSPSDALIRLLAPPFETSTPSPGYIQSYPPGVRENGGQYTHAAAWVIAAFARLGDTEVALDLFAMVNPILRTRTAEDCRRYLLEPYSVAGDVYGTEPHVGRGGWSGYTGSAGWLYRVALEDILGLRLENGALVIAPVMPEEWPGFRATIRRPNGVLHIAVEHSTAMAGDAPPCAVELDGRPVADGRLPFDPVGEHSVSVRLTRRTRSALREPSARS